MRTLIIKLPVEIRGQLDLKFKLEVHNDAPEKFCERFPPILGSGHNDCSFQTALQALLESTNRRIADDATDLEKDSQCFNVWLLLLILSSSNTAFFFFLFEMAWIKCCSSGSRPTTVEGTKRESTLMAGELDLGVVLET